MVRAGVLAAALLLLALGTASADQLKGGEPLCVSRERLTEFFSSLANKDERQFKYLLNNGCVISKAGIPASVIETYWDGTVKARVYQDNGKGDIVYTNVENIVKEKGKR